MIIQLVNDLQTDKKELILNRINSIGYSTSEVITQHGHYIIGIGSKEFDMRHLGKLEGVRDIHRVSDQYKLVSKKWKVGRSEIKVGNDIFLGNGQFEIMAGPCSIEDENQIEKTLQSLQSNEVKIMRGGVYKPRSSPYSFRGLGLDGLKIWSSLAKQYDIKIITEVMMVSQIEPMAPYIDIFQVGARNSQNYNLLDALGDVNKPVLLKRGISGTLDELLHSAEYIFSNGNEEIMLCERGIRSYEKAYRNTLDLNAVPILRQKTHLPVIVDPSHGIGIRQHVPSMTLAAVASGADGIIVEIHPTPKSAKSDGQQTLDFNEFSALVQKIGLVKEALHG